MFFYRLVAAFTHGGRECLAVIKVTMGGDTLRQLQELAHRSPVVGGGAMFESAAPEGMFAPPPSAQPSFDTAHVPRPPVQGGGGHGDIEQGVIPAPEGPTLQSHLKSALRITVIAGALALLAWAIKVFFGAKGAHRAKSSEKMRDFVYEMDAMAQESDSEDEGTSTAKEDDGPGTAKAGPAPAGRRKKTVAAEESEKPSGGALASDPLYCFFEAMH